MTRNHAFHFTAVCLLAATTASMVIPASAQTGRFVMEKTDDGYVRMDSETGDISVCTVQGAQIVCKSAADERAAFQGQIEALEARVAVLERRLAAGNLPAPAISEGLPSDEEFERSLTYMEKFMRRFIGVVKDLEGDKPI